MHVIAAILSYTKSEKGSPPEGGASIRHRDRTTWQNVRACRHALPRSTKPKALRPFDAYHAGLPGRRGRVEQRVETLGTYGTIRGALGNKRPHRGLPAIAKSVSAALSGRLKRGVVVRTGEAGAAFWEGAAWTSQAHSRAADAGEAGEADDCGEGTRADSLGLRRRRTVRAPCRCSDRSDGIRIPSRANSIATIAIRIFGNCISKAARSKGSDVDSLR